MKIFFSLMVAALLMFPVLRAEAEPFDEAACGEKCMDTQSACEASIKAPNDIEVQDAKAACQATMEACKDVCWTASKNSMVPPPEEGQPGQPTDQPQN